MDFSSWVNSWLAAQRAVDLAVKNSIVPDPALIKIFQLITQAGSGAFLGLVALALLIRAMRKRQLRPALVMAGGLCTVYLAVDCIKELLQRARPLGQALTWAPGYSFPSGHSACSMFVYGFLIYWLFRQDWSKVIKNLAAAALAMLIVLVGFSRIYLNAHYTSDVLAGFILGFAGVVTAIKVLKLWEKH